HADAVRSLVWSPDSRQLISACDDGHWICFWSALTGTQPGSPLQVHLGEINCMAISPGVPYWPVHLTITLPGCEALLPVNLSVVCFSITMRYTLAFSPNDQFVATGGKGGITFLWDFSQDGAIATGASLVSLLHAAPIPHFAGDVDQLRFHWIIFGMYV
ncbi:hypothetical protein BDN67DRAFT_1034311, partial [Paxillus ammoniavirescens]